MSSWQRKLEFVSDVIKCSRIFSLGYTIKGGYHRAEKSRQVMMMKAAKLGWAGPGAGQEQTMSRPGAGWEQARSRPGAMQEQGRSKSRAGALAVHIPISLKLYWKYRNQKDLPLVVFDWLVQSVRKIALVISNFKFNFYAFSTILMKFGMWTGNAPALLLLLSCSCIAPGLLLACS